MSSHIKKLLSVTAVASLVLAGSLSAEMLPRNTGRPQVLYPAKVDVSPPLRNIPIPAAKPFAAREIPNRTTSVRPDVSGISANIQGTPGLPHTPDPLAGWVGLGSDDDQAIIGGRLMP
ncbi:hypothetical protein EG835_12920, partial [bacterium]|nr:hypothetical protein [bacterium]